MCKAEQLLTSLLSPCIFSFSAPMPFLVGVHSSLMPVGTLHVSCRELNWNAVFFSLSHFSNSSIHHHHHHHHHHWSTEEQSTVSLLIQLAQLGLNAHNVLLWDWMLIGVDPFLVDLEIIFPFFLFQKVRQMPLDEVVIVDADTNVVESPFDDVSQLPADAVSHFLIHQVCSCFC